MTIDKMMKIEPGLQDVVTYVWHKNLIAKNQYVDFWEVYENAKKMLKPLVGYSAKKHELANSYAYNEWIEFIQLLSCNMLDYGNSI